MMPRSAVSQFIADYLGMTYGSAASLVRRLPPAEPKQHCKCGSLCDDVDCERCQWEEPGDPHSEDCWIIELPRRFYAGQRKMALRDAVEASANGDPRFAALLDSIHAGTTPEELEEVERQVFAALLP